MVEGIIYQYRCGIAWRNLPEVFGPWQTVWTWHHRLAAEGVSDTIVSALIAQADAEGLVDQHRPLARTPVHEDPPAR